jgi:hypothetical protein
MSDLRKEEIKKLAAEIAEELFTNGSGDIANRLVLENRDRPITGYNFGSWSRRAVEDRITEKLIRAVNTASLDSA